MAWYDEAVFYHIYPLGLTGAPKHNDYGEPVHRMRELFPWIEHIKGLGCNAIYIGPLFESVGHGYETTDYMKLDSRLGTNEDLKEFVAKCHEAGVRVIFDGVFNHTGRDFFAFKDIQANRENSRYRDWYSGVNFGGNNGYNDGFSYDNWGGYDLLVRLNQHNPEVQNYICDVIRFWVSEFDVDGIRLDTADVLEFDFMRALRGCANEVKEEFWLMGEVIHGDYNRWVNAETLHSVTNYQLHKALYSSHNDHNYFEVAHTIRHLQDLCGPEFKLYNFVDNHDVERIITKLHNKAHFLPVHVMLYSLPGIPSIYYGSEYGIEGRKEQWSDDSIRPSLNLAEMEDNWCSRLVTALGRIHAGAPMLSYGDYEELLLRNEQFAYARTLNGVKAVVTVNNGDGEAHFDLQIGMGSKYRGSLSGQIAEPQNGSLHLTIPANSGEIWLPEDMQVMVESGVFEVPESGACGSVENNGSEASACEMPENGACGACSGAADGGNAGAITNGSVEDIVASVPAKPYEEMTVEELQAAVLAKLASNGPVTDQMRRDVSENVYRDSLLNWVRSFR